MTRINLIQIEQLITGLARQQPAWHTLMTAFKARPQGVMEQCLQAPFNKKDNRELYSTSTAKIAVLFYSVLQLKPLASGNKKTAVALLMYALARENKWLKADKEDLTRCVNWVATAPDDARDQVVDYIKSFIEKHGVKG